MMLERILQSRRQCSRLAHRVRFFDDNLVSVSHKLLGEIRCQALTIGVAGIYEKCNIASMKRLFSILRASDALRLIRWSDAEEVGGDISECITRCRRRDHRDMCLVEYLHCCKRIATKRPSHYPHECFV